MRKELCSLAFIATTGLALGQGNVVVQVLTPASIADSYTNAYAVAASGWGVPDLTLPENAVLDTLAFGHDGTAADSLGCEALTNPEDVAGKIAVIYRGTCPFSQKATNAQNAGARALLLFSNGDDLAINMQGGDLGPTVTIPVIMISQTNGALIRPVMDAETVTALIGNNFGAFPNNLNIDGFDVMVPSAASMPPQLATDASEFQVNLGGFVHNFGSEAQATGRLRAVVSQAGNELYNEVADVGNLIAGDSVLVMLPQFTQPSYSGEYTITYSVESDVPDDFEDDNSFSLPLLFSGTFSYVPVDADTDLPKAEISVLPAEFGGSFRSCVAFADTNASRMAVTGLYFAGRTPTDLATPNDSALTDMLVTTYAYMWNDVLANAFTPPTDAGLTTLANGSYAYTENLQNEMVYIQFDDAITLDDNQRYLFCVETSDPILRHGWNEDVDYSLTNDPDLGVADEPTTFIRNGATWFNGFTGLGGGPAIGVRMIDESSIGINEGGDRVSLTPYPNPANTVLRVPMKGFTGTAVLRIFDLAGSLVSDQKVAVGGNESIAVDISAISAGTYLFHMEFENGQRSDFRVVVAK